MKIHILGGGIGGLTLAHYLSKSNNNFDINIYERNDIIGGQARSKSPLNHDYEHSEYCWHAISNGYLNLLDLTKEIISYDDKTVYEHLKPLNNFIYSNENILFSEKENSFLTSTSLWSFIKGIYNTGGTLTFCDIFTIIKIFLLSKIICRDRLDSYDNNYWKDMTSNLSKYGKLWIVESTSIFMGMDYSKLSTHCMMNMYRNNPDYGFKNYFFSFDGNINKVWFDPWKKQLEKNGVKIHTNTEIKKIEVELKVNEYDDNPKLDIIKIIINKNDDDITSSGSASSRDDIEALPRGIFDSDIGSKDDIYINSLDIENLAKLLPYNDYCKLYNLSKQTQTQVLYKFPIKLDFNCNTIIILQETNWFLMIRHEGNLWETKEIDLLSCGIGIWDKKGSLHKKTAKECTRKELAEECWYQISQTIFYKNHIKNNKSLKDKDLYNIFPNKIDFYPLPLPEYDIWFSFQYNEVNKQLESWESKFSNNKDTWKYRPILKDKSFNNLYHSTAYNKTETNLFCMESAVDAAKHTCNEILKNCDYNNFINIPKKQNYGIVYGLICRITRTIDYYIYKYLF